MSVYATVTCIIIYMLALSVKFCYIYNIFKYIREKYNVKDIKDDSLIIYSIKWLYAQNNTVLIYIYIIYKFRCESVSDNGLYHHTGWICPRIKYQNGFNIGET